MDEENEYESIVDSKYCDDNQFNGIKPDIPSSFGLFHVNLASLIKHIEDLKTILSLLNFNFDIIGIAEHKIKKGDTPKSNIDIPGYQSFLYQPTLTSHGGTGFYLKNNITYVERPDLAIMSRGNFESSFIEVKFPNKKNLIVGRLHRHPTSNISIDDFNDLHISPILQIISTEKKQCVLMGDFNVDLMKYDSHDDSNTSQQSLFEFFYPLHSSTY